MQKKTEARTLAALERERERERERESYTLKNKKINKLNIKKQDKTYIKI